jgi:hypothetical protein
MDDSGYLLITWFAAQSEVVQIALSLALLLIIAPGAFAVLIAGVNRIEMRVERWLTRRASAAHRSALPQSTAQNERANRNQEGLAERLPQR